MTLFPSLSCNRTGGSAATGSIVTSSARLAIWLGGDRNEDERFREYLCSLEISERRIVTPVAGPPFGPDLINVNDNVPPLFRTLVKQDRKLNDLWLGRGKHRGDCSNSGYDFSLVRRLMAIGFRDLDDLATVLAARPDGAVRQSGKGEDYIRLTLSNAIRY